MATKQQDIVEDILPDINKKYVYVLAVENARRGKVFDENGNPRGEAKYMRQRNVLFTSSILWPGGVDPFSKVQRPRGKYFIRFYDGCTTLFMDDQPKEKATIDSLVLATADRNFKYGYCECFGYETMLKLYLDWASYNGDSPYKVPSVVTIWKNVDSEKQILAEGRLLEMEDEARDYAKNAPVKKMRIHAKYLGISMVDSRTNDELSDVAIRIEYRKQAKANPAHFIKSYNDTTIEIRNWVYQALDTGEISTTILPNTATWKSGSFICDISGLKSRELIADRLVELSQTEDGGDFAVQLKAIYN